MKIESKEIKLIPINQIIPNERNPNKHSPDQIDRLCKIIQYSGFRSPLVISNLSGKLIVGHGRLESAKKLNMVEVPVIYQDFKDADAEYQHMIADNAISEWSDIDFSMVNSEIPSFDPEFDLDMLGIRDFTLDPSEKEMKGSFYISIRLADKDERDRLFDELTQKGFQCRTVNRKTGTT